MGTIHVGTGNIYGGGLSNYNVKHNWIKRLPTVEKLIRAMDCDVFTFCELHREKDADLLIANRIKDKWTYLRQGAGSGIFYKNTVQLVDSGWSALPEVKYKAFAWGLFKDPASNKQFIASNTHLSADLGVDRRKLRVKQTRYILQKCQAFNQTIPHLLGGDFNTQSVNAAFPKGIFADAGFYRLQRLEKNPPPINGARDSNNGEKDSDGVGPWIDDILVKNAQTFGSKLWPTGSKEGGKEEDQTGASDHWGWPSTKITL